MLYFIIKLLLWNTSDIGTAYQKVFTNVRPTWVYQILCFLFIVFVVSNENWNFCLQVYALVYL